MSNASLTGFVGDSTGAAVPGATVHVRNLSTNAESTTTTNGAGVYTVHQLLPDPYSLTVEKSGFSSNVQTGITLTVGQAATLNVTLQVGSAQQTVTVSGGPQLIDTTNGEISEVINQRSITELPLNGRNPASLVLLATGVTNVLSSPAGLAPGGTAFPTETNASAGGGRQGSTFYLLDGAPNMDTYLPNAAPFPNSDATQEFRVTSSNYDARYGYAPNAIVSIQTRSGSNAFHGGVFEFLRNDALNAKDYFSSQVDTLRRNQFGGFLGGPILRDKLFFFGNYQGTRQSTNSTANVAYTPTAAMLQGDFSAVPQMLTGGFGTVAGKPNQINPALFSPAAVAIANTALPLGQNPATGQVGYTTPAQYTNYDEGTGRLDYTINERQQLFVRDFTQFLNQIGSSVNGNLIAVVPAQPGKYYNVVLGHNWAITPRLANQVSLFWNEMEVTSVATPRDRSGNQVCMSRYIDVSDAPGECYLEGLSVTNGFSSGYNEPQSEFRRTYGFNENLSITLGNHTLTAGGNLWRQFAQESTEYPAAPIIGFSNTYTGFGLADFLLGHVNNFTQGGGELASVKGWQFGLYVQDEYRVRPNITLTAGLRWDPNLPPASQGGRGSEFRPGEHSVRFPNAPTGMVFPGDPGVDGALQPTTYGYFEPRVGFSWQPSFAPHTAVRAGFGLFTGPLPYSTYNHAADIAPFSPTFNLNASPSTGYNIPFGAPWSTFAGTAGVSPFPPFTSISYVPPATSTFQTPVSIGAVFANNFKTSVTQSWNLAVDQQFSRTVALHLAYVGNESYHLATILDLNPGIEAQGGQRTTYPFFGQILSDTSIGSSPYQSLQVGVDKRFSHGLQFRSNFTWSKVLSLSDSGNLAVQGGLPNPFNIRYNRGISLLNVPYVSTSDLVYITPALRGRNWLVRGALGDWEVSGIVTAQSGQPFGISGGANGNNNSGSLQYGDRADVVPDRPAQVHQGSQAEWLQHYVLPGSFVANQPGTFGNSGKNIFITPAINSTDSSLAKNWAFDGQYRLQFRWEMYNTFNHPSFGAPNTDPTASNFGQITGTGAIAPRVMQAALKLMF